VPDAKQRYRTAALHLALHILGVKAGDEVLVSTLTFSASANAVVYLGASPVFVDSERRSWNLDPGLVAEELERRVASGRRISAVLSVDLYGQCADYGPLREVCRKHGVPLLEDAAEALGATWADRCAGTLGDIGIFSFNGNKIITTSGGGMLVTERKDWADEARFLATQARDPAPHYQHSRVGYNYRLSNLLAAIGRGQLRVLDERVARRRSHNAFYRKALGDLPGIEFLPEAPWGRSTCWLTCVLIDPVAFGSSREDVRLRLDALDIEARPVWKPMHLQPVFAGCRTVGGDVAADLFERGLCLPSGSGLAESDRERVVEAIRTAPREVRRTGD
jgi:dTDP-4-amino-4,6-dideoxygalactose transaminase